jgi:RNA recognition motif-containing protein
MSFTVFLGNLPAWVTADDIKGWLTAENLVADAIKVIRNPETQESKGFAFIEAPNTEEMNSIIRRFDRAPLEDRLLRANPAQPPKAKGPIRPGGPPPSGPYSNPHAGPHTGPHSAPYSGGPRAGQDRGSPGSTYGPVQSSPPRPAVQSGPIDTGTPPAGQGQARAADLVDRPPRRGKKSGKKPGSGAPPSAFAEELAKVL